MSCSFQFYFSIVFHLLSFPRKASTGKHIPTWSFSQLQAHVSALCSLNSKTKDAPNANNFGYLLDLTSDSSPPPSLAKSSGHNLQCGVVPSAFIYNFKDYLGMKGTLEIQDVTT